MSNEVNAGYAAGAFSQLDMTHLVSFWKPRSAGPRGVVWDAANTDRFRTGSEHYEFLARLAGNLSHVYGLLETRAKTVCKIINAFEHDAPVQEMLDRYRIAFLHESHGSRPTVSQIGRRPAPRAGSEQRELPSGPASGCRPVSFTYAGDPEAPIPLPRM